MHWNACFMTEYDSWKQVALLLRNKIFKKFRCLKPFSSAQKWVHAYQRCVQQEDECTQNQGRNSSAVYLINVLLTSCLHWFKHFFILFWVTTSKLVSIWEMATTWLFIINFPFVQEWFSCAKLSTGMLLWTRQSIFLDWWEITKASEIKIMGISFAAWNLLSTWIKVYDLVCHQKVK